MFESVWPKCWDDNTVCSANWVDAVSYLEVVGIIVGQILVGYLGDWYVILSCLVSGCSNSRRIGRRWGLIQDAFIMTLGLVMLTAAWGLTLQGWVICYAWSLFVYGVGVGKYFA